MSKIMTENVEEKIVICDYCQGRGTVERLGYLPKYQPCYNCNTTGRMRQVVTTQFIQLTVE